MLNGTQGADPKTVDDTSYEFLHWDLVAIHTDGIANGRVRKLDHCTG